MMAFLGNESITTYRKGAHFGSLNHVTSHSFRVPYTYSSTMLRSLFIFAVTLQQGGSRAGIRLLQ
jgi:hypothetical protein